MLTLGAAVLAFSMLSPNPDPDADLTPSVGFVSVSPAPAPGESKRVGGDLESRIERTSSGFRSGSSKITTPLPEGYPDPTPPGAIDVKSYPSVRRAQVTRSGGMDWGMNMAFWPLFRHIERRGIAMTSPVEMDLPGLREPDRTKPTSWTMSFLYRTDDLGPTGRDKGDVEVVDVEPTTVVSIGFRGAYGLSRVRTELEALEQWLADQSEWVDAGEARVLYYNGPEARNRDKWGEVQIPVRHRAAGESR